MRRFGVFAMGALVGGAIVWAAVAQEIGSRALPFSRAREAGNTLYLSGQIA